MKRNCFASKYTLQKNKDLPLLATKSAELSKCRHPAHSFIHVIPARCELRQAEGSTPAVMIAGCLHT